RPEDRVRRYFETVGSDLRIPGTIFTYDSPGTFVVGALVEKIAGMSFIDFLQEKLFRKIGVSEDIDCLLCPGGHAWSDSAILCRPTDLLKVMRFTANLGEWNGEQLIDREFMKKATTKQIETCSTDYSEYNTYGYGYYIWMNQGGGFSFCGMGSQFAIYAPEKDMILIYNADNQGDHCKLMHNTIFNHFFDLIVNTADSEISSDVEADRAALSEYSKSRILKTAQGKYDSEWQEKISGSDFEIHPGRTGITALRLDFTGDEGKMTYTKDGKEMELPFGIGKNVFSLFPEDGYSDRVGSVAGNRRYECATSAAWLEPHKLLINCQIIDTYFGNLQMVLSFTEDGRVSGHVEAHAEDFLWGYNGYFASK
ncbi:MAG: serine hydrolase, partial [Clostridia bacterium]|nr:serine hydrolase [Clostridia bacterium]